MRQLLILTTVVALAAAGPRLRRQAADPGSPIEYCNGGKGVCVHYIICVEGFVDPTGGGIFETRIGGEERCSNFLYTCCKQRSTTVPTGSTNVPTESAAVPTVSNTVPTVAKPSEQHTSTCGKRNREGISQGSQDRETQAGEFPWMTAVRRKEVVAGKEVNMYLCGGSLIHPSIVLTSAYCVYKYSGVPIDLRVSLGEWDMQTHKPNEHQEMDVQSVVIHPGFTPKDLRNDYALLYLATPAVLSRNVDVICLDKNPSILASHHNCVVTGWGKGRFGEGKNIQNLLKKVDLPFVDFNQCQGALRTTRLGRSFNLDQSFLCAGGEEGKDSCSGDGGSPLVCRDSTKTQYVQIGIVSWGIGCGTGGVPGVYADVLYGYDWIVEEADKLLAGGATGVKPVTDYWNYA